MAKEINMERVYVEVDKCTFEQVLDVIKKIKEREIEKLSGIRDRHTLIASELDENIKTIGEV